MACSVSEDGRMEGGHGLALVLEVICHQSLQHFFSSGWLKGTEEKAEGRGDSKDTFQFGIPRAGNEDREGKSWEVASTAGGWQKPARQTCGRKMACSPSSESPIG